MTLKTLCAAAALTAASALSAAAECGWKQQAMSCGEGMTYDSDTRSCVTITS